MQVWTKLYEMEKKERVRLPHKYFKNPTACFSSIAKSIEINEMTVGMVFKRYKESLSIDKKQQNFRRSSLVNKMFSQSSWDLVRQIHDFRSEIDGKK